MPPELWRSPAPAMTENRIINTEERVIYATNNGIGGATEDWVEASTPTSLLAAHLTTMPSDPYTVRKVQVKPYFCRANDILYARFETFQSFVAIFLRSFRTLRIV